MRNQFAALALLALAACGGDSPTVREEPTPEPIDYSRVSLNIVGGDAQTDTVMRELDQALAVEVRTPDGRPVPNVGVSFVVTDTEYRCGRPFAGSAVTNATGRAMERWTLGHVAGTCTMEVRAVNPETGQAIVYKTFTATAVPDTFVTMVEGFATGAFPFVSTLVPGDQWSNRITSYRLEAPAGAPIQVAGAVEGTPEARTIVRVDSAAWAQTRPLGNYGYTGTVNPYTRAPVLLRLYVGGKPQRRAVCAGQGRNVPQGRYDQIIPGQVELRLAPNWAEPVPADPCQSF